LSFCGHQNKQQAQAQQATFLMILNSNNFARRMTQTVVVNVADREVYWKQQYEGGKRDC